MSGSLDLTPWARDAMTVDERRDVVDAIPDGYTIGVNHDRQRRQWVFWNRQPDGTTSHQLRISGSMALRSACFYALRHWKLLSETHVTLDSEGYIKEISDAG